MQGLSPPYLSSRFVNGVSLHSMSALGVIKLEQYVLLVGLVDSLDRYLTKEASQNGGMGIGLTQIIRHLDSHPEYGVISPFDKVHNAVSWRLLEIREVEYQLSSGASFTMKRVFLTQEGRKLLENAL